MFFPQKIRGPRPDLTPPYFPDQDIEKTKAEFSAIAMQLLTEDDLCFLRNAIKRGHVNGALQGKGFFSTIARGRRLKSTEELRPLLKGLELPDLDATIDSLNYWFRQIIGDGSRKSREICRFTEITIGWCNSAIDQKRKKARQVAAPAALAAA
jgi:hypothetical protein